MGIPVANNGIGLTGSKNNALLDHITLSYAQKSVTCIASQPGNLRKLSIKYLDLNNSLRSTKRGGDKGGPKSSQKVLNDKSNNHSYNDAITGPIFLFALGPSETVGGPDSLSSKF